MSEWIRCSDELPKLGKNVLTMLKDCDVDPIQIMSLTMCYTEDGWWSYWKTQEESVKFEPDEIIAWQPLPEPYQEATVSDLISREEAVRALGYAHFKNYGNAIMVIQALPSAEPKRKTGKWMGSVCSECGNSTSFYYDCDYCPNCGADMREKKDD